MIPTSTCKNSNQSGKTKSQFEINAAAPIGLQAWTVTAGFGARESRWKAEQLASKSYSNKIGAWLGGKKTNLGTRIDRGLMDQKWKLKTSSGRQTRNEEKEIRPALAQIRQQGPAGRLAARDKARRPSLHARSCAEEIGTGKTLRAGTASEKENQGARRNPLPRETETRCTVDSRAKPKPAAVKWTGKSQRKENPRRKSPANELRAAK
jgi:hypothetical protein